MNISRRILLSLVLAIGGYGALAGAAVLPPEKLLPQDTLLVVTAPDWGKARLFWSNQPYARFLQDPGLKPFKVKFMDKFSTSVIKPLEQSLGIKFSDYASLAQGQVTLAVVPVVAKTKSDDPVAVVLLVDTKDHAPQLKANLAQLLKKWADAGKPMKSQQIREKDFTTLFVSSNDLAFKKLLPGGGQQTDDTPPNANPAPAEDVKLTVGQSDSLLVVSDSTEAIEKILSRQNGGMVPPLEESPNFQADYGPRLRQSPVYVWLNAKALTDLLLKQPPGGDDASPIAANIGTVLNATGLGNLRSLSFSYKHYPEGDCTQLFVSVPEDRRGPLLGIFAAQPKDAGPPPFVPADAAKYMRYRLNVAQSWKKLEVLLNDLVPAQVMAQVNMVFAMAGKDKDEHYDLKAELLNNLGDDIIAYSKPPQGDSVADIKSPPTLYLLGSPNPEKLAAAVKILLAIPFAGAPVTDREFLGRKIYNIAPPTAATGKSSGVSFCASGGYLAIAADAGILEEYLRSSDTPAKPLKDMPGLTEAAQKVGGMGTGLFGYENEPQTMRPLFELLRKQNPSMVELLGIPNLNMALSEQLDNIREWADFSLLPPFDTVAKYFSFSVYAGSLSPDGFSLNVFMPTPPALRQ